MSVHTLPAPATGQVPVRSRTLVRLLTPIAFLVVFAGILGARTVITRHQADNAAAAAAAAASRPFPTSPQIEAAWGVRFTTVRLLADGGDVELRYTAIDSSKDGRLHSSNVADLPYLRAEDTGQTVNSNSLMLNLHISHAGDERVGGAYSIIYGNSSGAIRPGQLVTIVLADGLELQHVAVS